MEATTCGIRSMCRNSGSAIEHMETVRGPQSIAVRIEQLMHSFMSSPSDSDREDI